MSLRVISIAILVLGALVTGCGEDDDTTGDLAHPRIHLLLAPADRHAEITRIVVTVTGPDMGPIEEDLEIDGKEATTTLIVPAGEDRLFRVEAYSGDEMEYQGEETIKSLNAGEEYPLEVPLKPVQLEIGIVPSEIKTKVDDTFEVEIRLSGVKDLFGYSMEIDYKPDFLEPLKVIQGDFLGSDALFLFQVDPEDREKRRLSIGASRKADSGGVNGSGVIARVTFKSLVPTGAAGINVVITEDDLALEKEDGMDVDRLGSKDIKGLKVVIE